MNSITIIKGKAVGKYEKIRVWGHFSKVTRQSFFFHKFLKQKFTYRWHPWRALTAVLWMIGIGSLFPLTFSYNTFQIYDIWIAKLSHDGSFKYKVFTVLCCCSSLHERRDKTIHKLKQTKELVIFLDFHSTKQGQPLVDSWSHGLDWNQIYPDHPDRDTFEQLYPAQDTLQHAIKARWNVEWQKAGKTLPGPASFLFFVNEHNNTNKKPQAIIKKETIFKVIPEEKQQLVEETDADNNL